MIPMIHAYMFAFNAAQLQYALVHIHDQCLKTKMGQAMPLLQQYACRTPTFAQVFMCIGNTLYNGSPLGGSPQLAPYDDTLPGEARH